jgi:ATP-dependent helicase HrpB
MLPVEEIYSPLKAYLQTRTTALIIAPPGAGKTTGIPLALLDEEWLRGQTLILLEPRRLAARAAAARMAETLGESVGETVGFRVRGESRIGPKTRIEVVTEGIFSRRIVDDPALDGVGGVIFDEFHERSLDADLGLAFARDSQTLLRDDLRLLIMSATLDGQRVTEVLSDAQTFHSEGRAYPVTTHYLGRDQGLRLEDDIARHILRLQSKLTPEQAETLLVFLPGQGEIHRVASRLEEGRLHSHIELCKLYGAMDIRDQSAVLRKNTPGRPKIVLATAIAETSLTLDRVTMVIDSGVSRLGRYDPARGTMRFVTERVTKASADQRRGRAGRTQAGDCYRLWDKEQDLSLIPFARPEILETDLSRLVLDLRMWGARSTEGLSLLDHPPEGAMAEATRLLQALGALDDKGDLTTHGRLMSQLPMSPRLANMLLHAAKQGQAATGAALAALLSENGLGGKSTDLETRLEGLSRDKTLKAVQARNLALNWTRLADSLIKKEIKQTDARKNSTYLLAEAFPERIAKARGKAGEFVMANGRGAYVDDTDPLARSSYLAAGDLGGGGARDRILLGAPLTADEIMRLFADRLETEAVIEKSAGGNFRAFEQVRLGQVVLSSKPMERVPTELLVKVQAEEIKSKGLKALKFSDHAESVRQRVQFLRNDDPAWPDMSDAALLQTLEDWLGPYAGGRPLLNLTAHDVMQALTSLLSYEQQRTLDALAPESLRLPTGNGARIDYGAEGGPRVEARVTEFYGTARHPTVGVNKTPLTLSLLSPAHRPIQITKDIVGFWDGSWPEVRTEMKGRYPRHVWPEDPKSAQATARAKPRGT